LYVNKKALLNVKGPLLIAANHPDSFLDAILLSSIFKQPIYSLARGDVFKKNWMNKLFRSLKMFPVYRVSEGVENLEHNYQTFDDCIDIFKKNGIVLIFSEGRCINEWHLRPLKKGTARLAVTAWEQGIPLQILPLGINYNSFTAFGKNIKLYFGNIISKQTFSTFNEESFGNKIQQFNLKLKEELTPLVIETDKNDTEKIRSIFSVKISFTKKAILFLPAIIGFVFHAPLYFPLQQIAQKRFSKNDHYDSVLTGLLFIFYPFYLIIFAILFYILFAKLWWLAALLLLPVTAWSFVQLKKQF
jgi:1-acyl-sn-glycerol-3-phosphate acyltransferase